MSPDTRTRVFSALILILVLASCLFLGTQALFFFLLFAGFLILDEVHCNFFKKSRSHYNYFISQSLFVLPFVFFNLYGGPAFFDMFVNAGVVLNIFLLLYLFGGKSDSKFLRNLTQQLPYLSAVLVLLPVMSLSHLLQFENWREFVIVILFVNFSMDTGAWFFGRKFGKHKLWPAVSPKKTIEGLIGGILTSGFMGTIFWQIFFSKITFILFLSFSLLGLLSQIGDLIQSKLKRQFHIKDSSSLIPGHGGVYDRVDSLLFLAPFYAVMLKYFYLG